MKKVLYIINLTDAAKSTQNIYMF